MFADENMNDIGLPGTSSATSSSKFVIETKEEDNETLTIDNVTYNKKEELKKLELLIFKVTSEVRALKEIMGNTENDSSLSNVMEEEVAGFPIQAYTQLVFFNNKLKEDPGYRMKVVNRLRRETAKSGSINRKVKDALNVLLDRSLARNMNWSGRSSRRDKPKHGFQQFGNIFKILLALDDDFFGERAVINAIQVYFNSV